jgi:hypothetical protein
MVVLPVPVSPWINTGGNAVCIRRFALSFRWNGGDSVPYRPLMPP